ncbi:MAG TPA: hypothetical protein PKM59_11570 [Thermodesulfobacteriota bacterium]|nr:hypothetical protein [Thermodesulfobacteriota bacterium]
MGNPPSAGQNSSWVTRLWREDNDLTRNHLSRDSRDCGTVQLPPGTIAKKQALAESLRTFLPLIAVAGHSFDGTSLETSYLNGCICMAANQIVHWARDIE